MLIKNMKITNSRGDSITFGRQFKLIDDFELSGLAAEVNYSETTMDGSNYQNTVLSNRPFTVPFFIEKTTKDPRWYELQRSKSFEVWNPTFNPMRVDFETMGGKEYYINANVEATPSYPTGLENDNYLWAKGFLHFNCGDPYYYSKSSTMVVMGNWVPNLEFPLELVEGGIEFGYYERSLIRNVNNSGNVPTGVTITFKANGNVTNPSLVNVNTYEHLKLEIDMIPGDIIEVNTHRGKKSVLMTRGNVVTDVFNIIPNDSTFLQIQPGDNLIRYDAEHGVEEIEVIMTFDTKFVGV